MSNKGIFKQVVSAILLLSLIACEEGSVSGASSAGSGSGSGSGSSTSTTTTDVKKVVTTGPSLTFNDMTGGPNDLALNPKGLLNSDGSYTPLPAVVYYDKSSYAGGGTVGGTMGALKYAYVDSYGNWTIEVVDVNYSTTGAIACGTANSFCVGAPNAAGGSTANILGLAFKSTGLPVIAYVYGASANTTSGYKQVRIAERDSSGNWTISVAASYSTAVATTNVAVAAIDPIKGLKLGIDSSDNLHVTYAWYAQTTTANSYQKYLYRNSVGSWTETNITTIATGAGTVTVAGTGTQQSGMAICTISGTQYIAISFSNVTGAAAAAQNPVLSIATLSQTTGAGSFTNYLLGAAAASTSSCNAGAATCFTTSPGAVSGIRTDVACRPDGKVELGIFATTATAFMSGTTPSALSSAQSTAAGNPWGALVSGTANDGSGGFRLFVTTSDTADLLYYVRGVALTMFSRKGFGGAWTSGTTIEANTFAAEGVGGAYNDTNDVMYMSYARLPGANGLSTGNDIIMASGSTVDAVPTGLNPFAMDLIDQTANFATGTAIPLISAAKASNGTVGYAFMYSDTTAGDSKLYYGARGGTATNPIFSMVNVVNYVESVANTLVGTNPSLAYDSNNQPVIAFYNALPQEANLQVARTGNNGANFSILTVDDTSASTGLYPSAVTSGTSIGIAYYNMGITTNTTDTGLKFARYIPGKGWKKISVDGMWPSSGTDLGSGCSKTVDAGKYASLKLTSDGIPVIVYQRDSSLFIAVATEAITSTSLSSSTWTCRALDAGANIRGEGTDLALSSSNIPSIVHFDATAYQIRHVYSTLSVSVASTITSNAFASESIVGVGSTITVSQRPQIELATDGTKWVSYYSGANQGLALSSKASTASSWTTEMVDANTGGGSYTSYAGLHAALLINSSDKPMCFYRSTENWLKYFSREVQ